MHAYCSLKNRLKLKQSKSRETGFGQVYFVAQVELLVQCWPEAGVGYWAVHEPEAPQALQQYDMPEHCPATCGPARLDHTSAHDTFPLELVQICHSVATERIAVHSDPGKCIQEF